MQHVWTAYMYVRTTAYRVIVGLQTQVGREVTVEQNGGAQETSTTSLLRHCLRLRHAVPLDVIIAGRYVTRPAANDVITTTTTITRRTCNWPADNKDKAAARCNYLSAMSSELDAVLSNEISWFLSQRWSHLRQSRHSVTAFLKFKFFIAIFTDILMFSCNMF